MRIPMNSFDADDMAICRSHGDAIDKHRAAVGLQRWSDACAPLTQINLTVRAFEVDVHMPDDPPLPPDYWSDLEHWLKTLAPAKPVAPRTGWIPHTPTADSTCPVPDGVKFDVRLRNPSIPCPMSAEELLQSSCMCWWRSELQRDTGPSDFDIISWRPIADGRK